MFKYRIRMFFNELKVLLLMRSGSSRRTDTDPNTQTTMRGLAIGGCDWPQLRCSQRDDEEEYYGSDLRPRSLAFEDKEGAKPQGGGVGNMDAASLPSLSESGTRSPQCRICFQGPEKVKLEKKEGIGAGGTNTTGASSSGLFVVLLSNHLKKLS